MIQAQSGRNGILKRHELSIAIFLFYILLECDVFKPRNLLTAHIDDI